METERQVCPSCGSKKMLVNKSFFCDWEALSNKIFLTFCQKCGLAFFNKTLSKEQIDILYSDNNYFKKEWCWYGKAYQEVWRERKKEFESKQLKWIKKLKKRGKILDIGCAGGAIVKAFNEAGYNAIGAEYNEILVKFGITKLGVNITNIDVTTKEFLRIFGKFDILYMADFLEHLNEPKIFLESLNNILKNDGLIIIDVPLVELNRFSSRVIYFYTKLRNERIRFKSKPYHLIFFRINSLIKLCRNAGYKIERLKTWKENVFKEGNYKKMGLKYYILNKLDHILPILFGRVFDDRAFIVLRKVKV